MEHPGKGEVEVLLRADALMRGALALKRCYEVGHDGLNIAVSDVRESYICQRCDFVYHVNKEENHEQVQEISNG